MTLSPVSRIISVAGDPNDRSLRKVEKDVMVPKLIRERTKSEKCVDEVKEFHDCCLKSGILHVVKCRRENDKMQECMKKWFYNEDFIKECTEQYLDERSEFRRTGISKKQKNLRIQSSM
ncbi:COX assembly mitochondrial protein homolog isoform X2 [Monomorium pharaonis]|uniref:COX assembly mitochondrial protein homolog isoform X2 n=1 Tax=Monomorium pharaonis TaxID=307658 RepID=UPI00063F231C|nr:COX assembly mitochondrial protein homolog isoform X2 [Monomorium pharaonis]